MNEHLSDLRGNTALSPLPRLLHTKTKDGATLPPLGAEINPCWDLILTVYQPVQNKESYLGPCQRELDYVLTYNHL